MRCLLDLTRGKNQRARQERGDDKLGEWSLDRSSTGTKVAS